MKYQDAPRGWKPKPLAITDRRTPDPELVSLRASNARLSAVLRRLHDATPYSLAWQIARAEAGELLLGE